MCSMETWRPLYYPTDLSHPLPPLHGQATPLVETPMLTPAQLSHCGLEAWLGYQALRRSGCQECVPCANPSGEVLLEFYLTRSQHFEEMCIGINWFAVQYQGPDDKHRAPWTSADGQSVEGILGTGQNLADYKSLHYRYTDGRIMTRSGAVEPAPPGTTFGDRGALVNPAGLASHSNVRVPEQGSGVQEALVVWTPESIDIMPAMELAADKPDQTLWAYPVRPAIRLPNLWLQEHP